MGVKSRVDLTPPDLHKDKREIQYKERRKMGKKSKERSVYTKEFKVEAVALAEKREKPISQIAKDLGLNENVLRRWMQESRETGSGVPPDPEAVLPDTVPPSIVKVPATNNPPPLWSILSSFFFCINLPNSRFYFRFYNFDIFAARFYDK